MPQDWLNGLIGGGLIGAAAGMYLLGAGRIAGISGIAGSVVDGLLDGLPKRALSAWSESLLFALGLLLAPIPFLLLGGSIDIEVAAGVPALIAAGLLVGFGARLGSGCTSGHGVCGGARLSKRSLAAMGTFMAVAIAVVLVGRLV
jgi:uncharacterized membrane protein YedE/YeeE